MSDRAIVIVGSMAFDDLEFPRPIDDPERPGEQGLSFKDVVGGSATYASLTAACYAPAKVVAIVGEDFPETMLDRMRERGVDTAGVERVDGKTFRWAGRYHDDLVGRDTLDTQLNVFADFRPKLPESYKSAPFVLLGNIHPALQLEVLDQIDEPELVLCDTMNFWIEGEAEALAKVLARIDVLLINDEEARQLSGIHNIARAAKDILARGPSKLVIKRGEYGALYFDAEGTFAAPALLLDEVADPTGAGDTFAGGFLGYLAKQGRFDHGVMRRAMVHGTATASYCVEALGTSNLVALGEGAIHQRVAQIRDMFHLADD
ncbi:MAG: PfkB family carbohydrate kinase [Polyangiaceae bacterium]